MAKVKVKRGAKALLPAQLDLAEFGYCTDTKELFLGDGVANLLLNPPPGAPPVIPPPVPAGGNTYYNIAQGTPYYFDEVRGYWLAAGKTPYMFASSGNIDGANLRIQNMNISSVGYYIHRTSVITGIYYTIDSGNLTKPIRLLDQNDTILATYTPVNGVYVDSAVAVPLAAGSLLKCYATTSGNSSAGLLVQVEVAERYIP